MSEIKPALTPEEWADGEALREGRRLARHYPDAVSIGKVDPKGEVWIGFDMYPEHCHTLAALALHGQPFGFTWEDVDACRAHGIASLAVAPEPHPNDPSRIWWEEARKMDDLADRIAALLPPRQP